MPVEGLGASDGPPPPPRPPELKEDMLGPGLLRASSSMGLRRATTEALPGATAPAVVMPAAVPDAGLGFNAELGVTMGVTMRCIFEGRERKSPEDVDGPPADA